MAAAVLPGSARPLPVRADGYLVVTQSAALEERKQLVLAALSVNSLQVSPNLMFGVSRLLGGATPKYVALYYVENLSKETKAFPPMVDRLGNRIRVFPATTVAGTPVELDGIIRHHVYGKTVEGSPLPDYYDRYLAEPFAPAVDRGVIGMEGVSYAAGRKERVRKDPDAPEESARNRFLRLRAEKEAADLRAAMKDAEKPVKRQSPKKQSPRKSPQKQSPRKSPPRQPPPLPPQRGKSPSRSRSRSRTPPPAKKSSPSTEGEDYEDEDGEYNPEDIA